MVQNESHMERMSITLRGPMNLRHEVPFDWYKGRDRDVELVSWVV